MEASHLSMFSSASKMPKLGRKERNSDFPTMTAGQWNCFKSTCAPTFQLHLYLNLTIGVFNDFITHNRNRTFNLVFQLLNYPPCYEVCGRLE